MANSDELGRDRVRQLFEFLKELNNHRNPAKRQIKDQLWFRWLDKLPDHPNIVLTRLVQTDQAAGGANQPKPLLRVTRPTLTSVQEPPKLLHSWLLPGWDDWTVEHIRFQESRNELDDEGETVNVRFDGDLARVEALREWQDVRSKWRLSEVPARETMKVFDWLHALYGEITRQGETVELMLGTGVLSWQQTAGAIYHPLLAQRVQLVFDASVPEFTLFDADVPTELNMALMQHLEEIQANVLINLRALVNQTYCHPLAEEATGVLNQIPAMLASEGRFIGEERPALAPDTPELGRVPVLFLRKRAEGFTSAIDQVLAAIQHRTDFPQALLNVVGAPDEKPSAGGSRPTGSSTTPRRRSHSGTFDTLFAKEANPEQMRIAQRLNQHDCVLVQGPPGTGKSHTIANLIGHLLAQGKSVLVTSHQAKALKVLRGKLPKPLQPLCVSVLDNDAESKSELERAVQGIHQRLDTDDADLLAEQATKLRARRSSLIERLSDLETSLLQARESEYREVCFGGEALSPIDAAKWVCARAGIDDWIPGPVSLGASLPLTPAEVAELYETNERTRPEDDQFIDLELPTIEQVPSPEIIERLIDQIEHHENRHSPEISAFVSQMRILSADIEPLNQTILALEEAVKSFERLEPWELAAVDAGRLGEEDQAPWEHLLLKITELASATSAARLVRVSLQPIIPRNEPTKLQAQVVAEIISHLQAGRRLSTVTRWLHGEWKRLIRKWKIRGVAPTDLEHFKAIQQTIEVRIATDELAILWDGLMAREGAPSSSELMPDFSSNTLEYTESINRALRWWENRWRPLETKLAAWGLNWSDLMLSLPPITERFGRLKRAICAVKSQLLESLREKHAQLHLDDLRTTLGQSIQRLRRCAHPETRKLADQLESRDVAMYASQYCVCEAAIERQRLALRRKTLLAKLDHVDRTGRAMAGAWAEKIRSREGVHGHATVPGDVAAAWKWRQLNDELNERANVDLQTLGDQINQCTEELREVTVRLIDQLAWASQARRTLPRQRQALIGWLDAIHQIGAGFGIRVPELRRAARAQMKDCQSAVPVWIMPLTRLAENFDLAETSFDVVIIDEASQCDVMALMVLAIAKQVVVVGDHEQVSPAAVGQDLTEVQRLIRIHLAGIPNGHLYTGRLSIYDLARQSFGGQIRLVEHFRCVPEIIAFSNQLSYGDIKPLREAASSPLRQAVVEYRVQGASVLNKVNLAEAERVAALMIAAIEQPEYAKQSMGAVCLLGDKQALEIERIIRSHLSPQQIEDHKIVCGNPPQFQGDERHVMFLSLVDASDGEPLPLRATTAFKQRFNVAASRAMNQMWVVHSMDINSLQPADLRRQLIEHARDPKRRTELANQLAGQTDSEFELDVLKRLIQAGYDVHPQWEVGRYKIDLVVQSDSGQRLAVECDGDRYHGIDELPSDMARQAVLERLGWRFFRIRGSVYFRDPQAAISRLISRLDELGIKPCGQVPERPDTEPRDELVMRVCARADQLIAEWNYDPSDAPDIPGTLGGKRIGARRKSRREEVLFEIHESYATSDQQPLIYNDSTVASADLVREAVTDEIETQPDQTVVDTLEHEEETEADAIPVNFADTVDSDTEAGDVLERDLDSEAWFGLAKWARENDLLTSWDRRFAYSQGVRVSRGVPPTESQWPICLRIIRKADELGFKSESRG